MPGKARQNFLPQQLPGPAQPASRGAVPQQDVSPGPGRRADAEPESDEGAAGSFLIFVEPQA